MQDTKQYVKNQILVNMKSVLDEQQLNILSVVMMQAFEGVKMEQETALATNDDINNKIVQLFYIKRAPKLAEKTIEIYMNTLKKFIDDVKKPLTQVTTNDIELHLFKLAKRNISGATLNNYLCYISAMFDFMLKNDIVSRNPCNSIERYPETHRPVEHLDALDLDDLRDACKTNKQRALIEFMRCTALRRGEIVNIKINEVDFKNNQITVYGQKSRTYRIVFFDDVCKKYLLLYLQERNNPDGEEPLFAGRDKHSYMRPHGVYDIVRTIFHNSKVERRVYPHLFRKTTATNICRRGGTEDMAGDYLGHKPHTVTGRHYIYSGEEYVKEIFTHYVATV